jgi:hypothetical protein
VSSAFLGSPDIVSSSRSLVPSAKGTSISPLSLAGMLAHDARR